MALFNAFCVTQLVRNGSSYRMTGSESQVESVIDFVVQRTRRDHTHCDQTQHTQIIEASLSVSLCEADLYKSFCGEVKKIEKVTFLLCGLLIIINCRPSNHIDLLNFTLYQISFLICILLCVQSRLQMRK